MSKSEWNFSKNSTPFWNHTTSISSEFSPAYFWIYSFRIWYYFSSSSTIAIRVKLTSEIYVLYNVKVCHWLLYINFMLLYRKSDDLGIIYLRWIFNKFLLSYNWLGSNRIKIDIPKNNNYTHFIIDDNRMFVERAFYCWRTLDRKSVV